MNPRLPLLSLLLLAAPLAHAADANNANDPMLRLAQENACMTCHAIDHKLIGPAFHAVAARFRNNPNASAYLLSRLQHGSVGDWGQDPMPPNVQLQPGDAQKLVQWVLAQ